MQKIADYKCHVIMNKPMDQHFHVDKIDITQNIILDHEILVWNNDYSFSNKHLKSFPRLKMFVNWGFENKNIECEDELKKREVLIKKMDFCSIDYLTHEAWEIKNNTFMFYLKRYSINNSNTLYIARHGETKWNKQDIFQGNLDSQLTQKGITHAQGIAEHLFGKKISCIFSSPLGRSRKTAEIIASKIGAEMIVIPEFQEMHFGIFQGKKSHIVKRLFSEFFIMRQQNHYFKLFVPYPEGESYFDVYLRVIKPLMSLLARYNNFVIVGHESLNRVLRGIIQELPLEEMITPRQKNNELITINLTKRKEEIIYV